MRKIIILISLLLLMTGCAEEVVKKELSPTEMEVTIYFREDVDSSLYKYYMIFSNSANIAVPNINLSNPYFIRPGETYDEAKIQLFTGDNDNISYYYANYYKTWVDVTKLKVGASTIVADGPFPETIPSTDVHYTDYSDITPFSVRDSTSGKMIQLTFSIDAIKTGILTQSDKERIYFNFVVTSTDPDSIMQDYLDSEPSLKNEAGAQVSEYDSSNDSGKPGAADIVRWVVKIR
jgi:hypothetical protein